MKELKISEADMEQMESRIFSVDEIRALFEMEPDQDELPCG